MQRLSSQIAHYLKCSTLAAHQLLQSDHPSQHWAHFCKYTIDSVINNFKTQLHRLSSAVTFTLALLHMACPRNCFKSHRTSSEIQCKIHKMFHHFFCISCSQMQLHVMHREKGLPFVFGTSGRKINKFEKIQTMYLSEWWVYHSTYTK